MNNRQVKTVGGGGLTGEIFHKVISLENLLSAWREFRRDKRSKTDVQRFEWSLEDNLWCLHQSLIIGDYTPDPYQSFIITDPKPRRIHKASVRDRVLHQAVYRVLYQIFDPIFIFDSYACRKQKGLHRAVNQLEKFFRQTSHNCCHATYALQCDVKKFFDSVDQDILLELIKKQVFCPQTLNLLKQILGSFETSVGKGLPLGNVTSQIFANIYLNELDQFAKHTLKTKYYIRYCDDFLFVNQSPEVLEKFVPLLRNFLVSPLKLNLHDNKITIRKFRQGIDYLGYISRPYHRVLRTKTKRRILQRAQKGDINDQSFPSYLGILSHCRGRKIENAFLRLCYTTPMTQYRKGKVFDPQSDAPFRISRTKIDLFTKCPRCFYLDQRLGVKRPDTYPLTLNLAVDALLKKEFDLHRAKQVAHPMMKKYGIDAVPFQHEKINTWREFDFGRGGIHYWHRATNFDVYGVVDDVWINPGQELIIVDYKATAKAGAPTLEGDLGKQYKKQMEVYQWLFGKNNFKVSSIGYFVYVNGRRDAEAFDGKLEFDVSILSCAGDPRWIPNALDEMKRALLSPTPPPASLDCDFCAYRQAAEQTLLSKPRTLFS